MISLVCAYELESVAEKNGYQTFCEMSEMCYFFCLQILGNIRLPLLLGCHISIETVVSLLSFSPRTKINNNMYCNNYHPSHDFYNKFASRKKMVLLNIK